jgi:2-polyprenyl-6-methoxyphenol hydroxylase-like FAD-dependent oxidoreductase
MGSNQTEHEVIVVGARCAGAATSMLLARQGHDVVLVDRASFPSDTLSTHAIARGGVVQLARWRLLDEVLASGAPPIRSVRFRLPDGTDVTRTIKDRGGVDHLLAPRRHVLDSILLNAAREAGAHVRTGLSVTGTTADQGGRVTGVRVRDEDGGSGRLAARVVVGADGVRSRVARAVGAPVVDRRPSPSATWYAYAAGLEADGFEYHLADRRFAGVFPTHGGEANVWVCTPAALSPVGGRNRTESFVGLLTATSRSLGERVRRARITSPVRGAVGLPNHVRRAAGPGWALVGDAGYHRDPITGYGITDAFRDAELLAMYLGEALRGDRAEVEAMAAYADERRRRLAPVFDITWRLSQHPPFEEFVELQKRLSSAIDAEASWLAGLPPLGRPCCPAAA